MCYACTSTQNPGCGPYFDSLTLKPRICSDRHTACALQRQPSAKEIGQLVYNKEY